MRGDSQHVPAESRRPLLHPNDQLCIALVLLVALLVLAASWVSRDGLRGGLADVERVARKPVPFRLDVNRADWSEWSMLPGIGETLARRIVEQREREGPFQSHDDLLAVSGIGPVKLETIRPYLLPLP